jgi:hypothetical protein
MVNYLINDGAFGEIPPEYPLYRAARYMGVAPWELLEREPEWMDWALQFESAEGEARAILAKRPNRKKR